MDGPPPQGCGDKYNTLHEVRLMGVRQIIVWVNYRETKRLHTEGLNKNNTAGC